VTSLDLLSKYLLIMELRFHVTLCSNVGNAQSDAGHIKCSRGPQVPHPCCRPTAFTRFGCTATQHVQWKPIRYSAL